MSELLTFQKFCFLWRAPVNNSIDRTLCDLQPFIYHPSTSTFFLDAAKETENKYYSLLPIYLIVFLNN